MPISTKVTEFHTLLKQVIISSIFLISSWLLIKKISLDSDAAAEVAGVSRRKVINHYINTYK